jgi:hypothetical protein
MGACRPDPNGSRSRPSPVVLARGVARRFAPSRDLRHVDDARRPGLLRSLREERGGAQQPGGNRVDEIRAGDPLERRSHRIEVLQVSNDHLGAALLKSLRAGIAAMHKRADIKSALPKDVHGLPTGHAGGASDQELRFAHSALLQAVPSSGVATVRGRSR